MKFRNLLSNSATDSPPLSASLLVGALFLLGLQDALVKFASSEVSLWQFQFFRSAFNLLFLAGFIRLVLRGRLPRPKRLWAVTIRSLLLCTAMGFFFSGVPFLTLAQIAAGLYVFPLFVAVLSHFVLGEKVGPRRVVAIVAGFCGTLLILRPGTDAFTPVGLLPVIAGFFYACTIMATRKLCREEEPAILASGVAVALMVVGVIGMAVFTGNTGGAARSWPYVFTGWHWVEAWVYGVMVICSALNIIGNVSIAKAYQSAEASWLAPFDFSYMIWATVWGYVIWRDLPDGLMFAGMALIAASGAFVAFRYQQAKEET